MLGSLLFFVFIIAFAHSDECQSTSQEYSSDENIGEYKFPSQVCNGSIHTLLIQPKKDQIVTLSFEDLSMDFTDLPCQLDVHYINGKDPNDLIFVANAKELYYGRMSKIESPSDFGFSLILKAFAKITGIKITIKFNRAPLDTSRSYCPNPLLDVTEEAKSIELVTLPTTGCAFRFKTDWSKTHSIYAVIRYDTKVPRVWNRAINYLGVSEHFKTEMIPDKIQNELNDIIGPPNHKPLPIIDAFKSWTIVTKDFEMALAKNPFNQWKLPLFFQLEYYSKSEDPCLCNEYNTTLMFGQILNVTSPGYPTVDCPGISCQYTFQMGEGYNSSEFIPAFIINVVHSPKSRFDSLTLTEAKEISLGSFSMPREKYESLTIYEKEFGVDYKAASTLDGKNGFSMLIKAEKLPHDCVCPTNDLLSKAGNITMEIGAHCPPMSCRFEIDAPPLQRGNTWLFLRLYYAFLMPSSDEHLEFYRKNNPDLITTGGSYYWEHSVSNIESASKVEILYIRDSTHSTRWSVNSKLNLTWLWVSDKDCQCDSIIIDARPDEWQPIYSPLYPSDYCPNLDCDYKIFAPEGHKIEFNITDMATETETDFLVVFDGLSMSTMLFDISGFLNTSYVNKTLSNSAIIKFQTNDYGEYRGFKILVRSIPPPYNSHTLIWIILGIGFIAVIISVTSFCIYKRLLCFDRFNFEGGERIQMEELVN